MLDELILSRAPRAPAPRRARPHAMRRPPKRHRPPAADEAAAEPAAAAARTPSAAAQAAAAVLHALRAAACGRVGLHILWPACGSALARPPAPGPACNRARCKARCAMHMPATQTRNNSPRDHISHTHTYTHTHRAGGRNPTLAGCCARRGALGHLLTLLHGGALLHHCPALLEALTKAAQRTSPRAAPGLYLACRPRRRPPPFTRRWRRGGGAHAERAAPHDHAPCARNDTHARSRLAPRRCHCDIVARPLRRWGRPPCQHASSALRRAVAPAGRHHTRQPGAAPGPSVTA